MAVYTHVSAGQVSDFLKNYDLGNFLRHEGIQQGVDNSNFHLWTERGHYILTLFEKRINPDDLPFFFSFTQHLAARGINCPHAIPALNGEIFGTLAERPAVIVNFLEGADLAVEDITIIHCRRLGRFSAALHEAAGDFPLQRVNSMGRPMWQALAEETVDRADEVEPGLARLIADEMVRIGRYWPEDKFLPRAVVHADIFPDNVLWDGAGAPGLLDFYFSCSDFLAYDLAITVNAWCFDRRNNFLPGHCHALLQAYEAVRPLTQAERENFSLLCRGAAMRILTKRLSNWLFHDPASFVKPKDPRDYAARLRFHQNEQIIG